jgi:hypothetical protein
LMERTALALKWDDLDLAGHGIRLARAVSGGRIETPMSGHGRTVDMSDDLARALVRLQLERKTETIKHGWGRMPALVFCTEAGTSLDGSRVRKVMARVLN